MSRTLRALGIALALCACLVLCGCSSTTEFWQPDTQVVEEPRGEIQPEASVTGGWLEVRLTRPVQETRTPVERLSLLHEEVESTIDWDGLAMTVIYIVGSLVILGLYIFVAADWWHGDEDDE